MPFSAAEKRRRREAERNAALRGNPDALEKRAREAARKKRQREAAEAERGRIVAEGDDVERRIAEIGPDLDPDTAGPE